MKEYDDELLELLVYIKTSKYRKKILLSLESGKFKIPSEIAKYVDTITSHVSCHLSGLKKRNLITCVNEGAKKGRLYLITDKGKRVLKHLTSDEK
jgi:predicted transcriptional regulator